MTPINNYYGTHAGGSRGVDVWLGWSVASECQGRFLRRVRGYSHPSHRSSPNLPNEIFGECSWTSRMKIYWLYVGLGPYAKNCILAPILPPQSGLEMLELPMVNVMKWHCVCLLCVRICALKAKQLELLFSMALAAESLPFDLRDKVTLAIGIHWP